MAANSLLASAVQALCVIAWRGSEGANAELLAKSLDTNPVVVRRILKALERDGLVRLRPGRHGGVELSRSPADISLEEVYRAIAPNGALFALRERGNPRAEGDGSRAPARLPGRRRGGGGCAPSYLSGDARHGRRLTRLRTDGGGP